MDEIRDGSAICLSCGLCCQGMFHEHARVLPEEAARLESKGFEIQGGPKDLSFPLPCSHWGPSGCSVYADRPRACQAYQCRLLVRYRAGEVSLDRALETVKRVQTMRSQVLQRLGSADPTVSLWQQIRAREPESLDPETRLDIAALLAFANRHFEGRGEIRRAPLP